MINRRLILLPVVLFLLVWLATPVGANASQPLCDGLTATVEDTVVNIFGDDVFVGTEGDDVFVGTPGADTIYARGGDDVICGGGGADVIHGEDGRDRIFGENGDDTLIGGPGADFIDGGARNDNILGGGGNDRIKGGNGHDRAFGGNGQDVISGMAGHDTLLGGSGHDRLRGGSGNDRIKGQGGNDRQIGGNHFDMCDDTTTTVNRCESAEVIECALNNLNVGVELTWTAYGPEVSTGVYRNDALQQRLGHLNWFIDSRPQSGVDDGPGPLWSIRPDIAIAPESLRLPCTEITPPPPIDDDAVGCVVRDYLGSYNEDGWNWASEPGEFVVAFELDASHELAKTPYVDLFASVDGGAFVEIGPRRSGEHLEPWLFNGDEYVDATWRVDLTPGVWQIKAVTESSEFHCYPNFVVIE